MKVNLNAEISDLSGVPVKGPSGELVTLRSVSIEALLTPLRGDENSTGSEKAKCFMLASKISNPDCDNISAEDVVLIKDRIGRGFPALVVGRSYELLDLMVV